MPGVHGQDEEGATSASQPAGAEVLFSWLHLADLTSLSGPVADALIDDIAQVVREEGPAPMAVFLAGDVGSNVESGRGLVERLVAAAGGAPVFLVPGDADAAPVDELLVKALVEGLRAGSTDFDQALKDSASRAKLQARLRRYLEFVEGLQPAAATIDAWSQTIARPGLPVSVRGLNTALLASGEAADRGRLRLGQKQLHRGVARAPFEVVLSHHPVDGGWLADEEYVEPRIRESSHVHLTGPADAPHSTSVAVGGGRPHVRVAAGLHDRGDGRLFHFSFGALVRVGDEHEVRVWPRRQRPDREAFIEDHEHTVDGYPYAHHAVDMVEVPHPPTRRWRRTVGLLAAGVLAIGALVAVVVAVLAMRPPSLRSGGYDCYLVRNVEGVPKGKIEITYDDCSVTPEGGGVALRFRAGGGLDEWYKGQPTQGRSGTYAGSLTKEMPRGDQRIQVTLALAELATAGGELWIGRLDNHFFVMRPR